MKIRISGNSVRFRLSKSEVEQLGTEGLVEEKTVFPQGQFIYLIKQDSSVPALSASFEKNKIILSVPVDFVTNWAENNVTGLDNYLSLGNEGKLYLLLEKDFKCLDNVLEDQSDNYENPNKIC